MAKTRLNNLNYGRKNSVFSLFIPTLLKVFNCQLLTPAAYN